MAVLAISMECLAVQECILQNDALKISICSFGGKLVRIEDKNNIVFDMSAEPTEGALGFAKDRFYTTDYNDGGFMTTDWEMKKVDERHAVLSITGKTAPWNQLHLVKKFSLPESGSYIKVENSYQSAKIKSIVPWLHHAYRQTPESGSWHFILPHSKGDTIYRLRRGFRDYFSQEAAGNWLAAYDQKNDQGILVVSEIPAKILYSYHDTRINGREISTLEMLFEKRSPDNEMTFTVPRPLIYYIAPFQGLESLPELPIPLNPAFPTEVDLSQNVPAPKVKFEDVYVEPKEELPLEVKYFKSSLKVARELSLPMFVGMKMQQPGAAKLIIEVPEELTLVNSCAGYWRPELERFVLLKQEPFADSDGKYNRYIYEISTHNHREWNYNYARFFLQANAETIRAPLRIKAEYNGKPSGQEQSVPIKVVELPPVKSPENFRLIMNADYILLKEYPDMINSLKHLGINGIYMYYSVPSPAIPASEVNKLTTLLRKNNFDVMTMGAQFFAPPMPVLEDLQAIDVNGNRVPHAFDFTARGDWMQEVVAKAVKQVQHCGFDALISDFEAYYAGQHLSFTERSIKMFEEYSARKYPDLPRVDLQKIAKYPEDYPRHFQIWTDFKCEQFEDYLKTVIDEFRKKVPDVKVAYALSAQPTREGSRTTKLQDPVKFAKFCDIIAPMMYDNVGGVPYMVKDKIAVNVEAVAGTSTQVMPIFSQGFYYSDNNWPEDNIRYMVLEAAMAGCNGVMFWPGFAGSTAESYAEVGKAAKLIRRHEHIIRKGQLFHDLALISEAVNTTMGTEVPVVSYTRAWKTQLLVLLIQYGDFPAKFKYALDLPNVYRVKDAATGLELGLTGGSSDAIELNVSQGNRMHLLLLDSVEDSISPADFAPKTKEEVQMPQKKNVLLKDHFDGTTLGRNGNPKYSFQYAQNPPGQCLFFRLFQSFWSYKKNITLQKRKLLVELQFKMPKVFTQNNPRSHALLTLSTGDGRVFHLTLERQTGKMRLIERANKVWQHATALHSTTDAWGQSVWYDVKFELGQDGWKLWIDNELEAENQNITSISSISNVTIGAEWKSFGCFDNLVIYEKD